MKKKLLALFVPFCCCAIAPLCAQSTEDEETVPSVEVTTLDDAADQEAPPALFKKGKGCGCGK